MRAIAEEMREALDAVYYQEFSRHGDYHGIKEALTAFEAFKDKEGE